MSADLDIVIAGGGIVGAFCACKAAREGLSVAVLERESRFAEGATGRNSGVLHAGIYYKPGSNKALMCVEGNRESYRLAALWQAPHRRCGKLIVALDREEEAQVEELKRRGEANGVEGLKLVGRDRIAGMEPHAAGSFALLSPNTGIIDQPSWFKAVRAQAEAAGAMFLSRTEVVGVDIHQNGVTVHTAGRDRVSARGFINATGINAAALASAMGFDEFRAMPVRGGYATIIPRRASLVRGLLYPVPSTRLSLGVHLTRTMGDEVLVGPTAEPLPAEAAALDQDKATPYLREAAQLPPLADFLASARPLLPALELDDLRHGYFGIRAKVVRSNGEMVEDFTFARHPGAPHVLHLLGFDSPAFTSAPAIADRVLTMMRDAL